MFNDIIEGDVCWPDVTVLHAHVTLWCTGFRSSLHQLAPLMLREPSGGITMPGRLATRVAQDPRVHLVGYGPSASAIGADRAGRAAASERMASLGLPYCPIVSRHVVSGKHVHGSDDRATILWIDQRRASWTYTPASPHLTHTHLAVNIVAEDHEAGRDVLKRGW